MRIGLMLRHLGRQAGGTGTYTDMMVRHMLDRDPANRYVLFYDHESRLGYFGARSNVEEVVVRAPAKVVWDQLAFPLAARRHRVDVVFNPKASIPLLSGRPSVYIQHGADWFAMPDQYLWWDRAYFTVFAPLFWRKASAIISISKDSERRIAELMDAATARKIRTIHHGVGPQFHPSDDPAELDSLRQRHSIERPFFLYLGQIYPMKNVAGLIRAFARVADRIPYDLLLVGQPYLDSDRDLGLIERLGLTGRVRSLGWVPDADIPLFYRAAVFFSFPSLYEGFGIPLIEAMASGCPVLTSTGGACPEVAGDAALIVDPTSTESIADGLLRMATEPALRESLRARGLERARQFTWTDAAASTLDVIETAGRARVTAP